MDPAWLVLPGVTIWTIILLLPWRPWSTRESLDSISDTVTDLREIAVLIPARNEEQYISHTLSSVAAQGNVGTIVLIDDESSDRTAALAGSLNLQNLLIIKGKPLPAAWTGKLWALEQGRLNSESEFILLLDADIKLEKGILPTLLNKMKQDNLKFISLMAFLRMESGWEKMLMPAFIYFFKLLYPFRISNSESKLVAAAAGGCILIDRQALAEIGGFTALKNELIDDCALAKKIKQAGYRTWTGLTHSVVSQRCYDDLHTIWEMVSRTAFTQLKFSLLLLGLCTLLMFSAFTLPFAGLYTKPSIIFNLSIINFLLMMISYLPTLRYYGVNVLWAVTLPLTGLLYLLMTWDSAFNYWFGHGSSWKGRSYS